MALRLMYLPRSSKSISFWRISISGVWARVRGIWPLWSRTIARIPTYITREPSFLSVHQKKMLALTKESKFGTVHPPAMYSFISTISDTISNNNSIKIGQAHQSSSSRRSVHVCATEINLDRIYLRELFNFTVEWEYRFVKDTWSFGVTHRER